MYKKRMKYRKKVHETWSWFLKRNQLIFPILGDPGADKGGEEKSLPHYLPLGVRGCIFPWADFFKILDSKAGFCSFFFYNFFGSDIQCQSLSPQTPYYCDTNTEPEYIELKWLPPPPSPAQFHF